MSFVYAIAITVNYKPPFENRSKHVNDNFKNRTRTNLHQDFFIQMKTFSKPHAPIPHRHLFIHAGLMVGLQP